MEILENEEQIDEMRDTLLNEIHGFESSPYREFTIKTVEAFNRLIAGETEDLLGVDFEAAELSLFLSKARELAKETGRSTSHVARLIGHQLYLKTAVKGTIALEYGFDIEVERAVGAVQAAFLKWT